ncbi:dipicolinate synthase subunit DpsA [Desulfolucanica intricata]|uniref:dipicolinate synthase subunit DpsA n=1 Tax=Desulfolucanica intricata TaxID=1285191 RepID=UPI00082D63A2|nr:dipicolinate synthase subunit DpsA [Desulfolucanica intricata]
MKPDLRRVKIAVLGGDAREVVLVERLAALGVLLKVVGLPVTTGNNVIACRKIEEALLEVNAVILSVSGINNDGHLYCPLEQKQLILSEKQLSLITKDVPIFVGVAKPRLKEMTAKLGLRVIEYMVLDEVAILNSIPSAEGAIQLAMEKMPITLHSSSAFVLGFGRVGITLSRILNALGAKTNVVARNPNQLARAFEMGLTSMTYSELPDHINEADVIFNTVPALVLDETLLEKVKRSALIIDLASAPGGTDFEAAKKRGVTAILALGLPGKVAPKTAGDILARVLPRLLVQELSL